MTAAIRQLPQAHDLLWGMTAAMLNAGAPHWAAEVLTAGLPVVVRRGPAPAGQVAVGVRGGERGQRHACWMPLAAIQRRLTPEQLVAAALPQLADAVDCAVLGSLQQLAGGLDELGLDWGVTGAAAWQLATGQRVLHGASDLDLLLRAPQALERDMAAGLLVWLQQAACRVDVQLETPVGAIALAEWAGRSPQVLLKASSGPQLVDNPWQLEAVA